jgi:hypothetical protein
MPSANETERLAQAPPAYCPACPPAAHNYALPYPRPLLLLLQACRLLQAQPSILQAQHHCHPLPPPLPTTQPSSQQLLERSTHPNTHTHTHTIRWRAPRDAHEKTARNLPACLP